MSDVETHEQRAERGREIIAQVRELEAADKARFEAFAATIKSENKKYIHRRSDAAAMVAKRLEPTIRKNSLTEKRLRLCRHPQSRAL